MNLHTETIAAIATATGNAGISIVRLSGDRAFEIASTIFNRKKQDKKLVEYPSHTIHYGHIYDGDEVIDEVMVSIMKAPNTYTKEDSVEINCHGGIQVTKKVLDTVLKYGARAAEPGEFTKRAFLNGRIDLSQAEAVIDVIHAKNDMALKSSLSQLNGSMRDKICEIREQLLYEIAFIESALDDPEHVSLDGYKEKLEAIVEVCSVKLEQLLKTAGSGKILKEGIQTVILGRPNAGKSSLLNVLSGRERAIVTDIEGTTRDILEESIVLDDITLNIIDTAGIRDTEDVIEKIGVDKAKECAKDADLILYVVDSSRELDENDQKIIRIMDGKQAIVLLNKSDLEQVVTLEMMEDITDKPVLTISAREEQGIRNLELLLKQMFFEGEISFNDQVYITNVRHEQAVRDAAASLEMVKNSIHMNMPEDFYSIDLMGAYESLGYIIGQSLEEDLTNEIFSKFCTGK